MGHAVSEVATRMRRSGACALGPDPTHPAFDRLKRRGSRSVSIQEEFMKASLRFTATLLVALLVSSTSLAAGDKRQKTKDKAGKVWPAIVAVAATKVIWHDPGAVESLDFVGGPGGRVNAPKAPFTFVKEL